MAKYYVPFVNINTFTYEPCGLELNRFAETSVALTQPTEDPAYSKSTKGDVVSFEMFKGPAIDETFYLFQNQIGGSKGHGRAQFPIFRVTDTSDLKNHKFFAELPNTASFFTALNLKRNGPYGYPTWKQIRSYENPLIRNQKKKNILTVVADDGDISSYNQPKGPGTSYVDPRTIEVFREPVYSSREKNLIITFPRGNNIYRASFEMGSQIKYFENDRLNQLYAPYDFSDELQTDKFFKTKFLEKTFNLIGGFGVPVLSVEYVHTIFPQKSSLEYDTRVRSNFYHPWKDDRQKRRSPFTLTYIQTKIAESNDISFLGSSELSRRSRWPLDSYMDFLSYNADMESIYQQFKQDSAQSKLAGVLQNVSMYLEDLQSKNRNSIFMNQFFPLPRFSYNHTITPLTSCVGPHGMDIQGVNSAAGSPLFSDLSIDHIPSGDANWDAASQYGTSPFYDSYEEFIYDIKKVGKEYSAVPEFRSSIHFDDLQNKQSTTPREFLKVFGGKILDTTNQTGLYVGQKNDSGTTELGSVSASSEDSDFYTTYSHSDFMKNFDIVSEVANTANKPLFKMSLTCNAIKKFAPYEGFYPAERTIQIADKFRDSIIDNCAYTGSGAGNNVGDLSESDVDRAVYFNNIMTPMFAPGIMFNSIKSGLALDYPIHTSSLNLTNGGIALYDDEYYIQQPFSERIPFEALLEPADFLASKEIHCSEPHPSGNLSGSATWSGTGDTTEYQLMMHNFLAETADFFLQDQNFSFISSKRSDELNIKVTSGSLYAFDINLYKSQNQASDAQRGARGGVPTYKYNSLFMTGSGVQETFTMYSRPSAFGPPSRITSSVASDTCVATYSNLGYNWSFTPAYYDGISKISFLYKATSTGKVSLEDLFNDGVFIEQRTSDLEGSQITAPAGAPKELKHLFHNVADAREILEVAGRTFEGKLINSISNPLASLNVNLGIIKDVDLLDDDTSDAVKVAVDISSEKKSQIIIQPKWETPMFNFQTYSNSNTISLPLVGSQSVPRGIWHQYGEIETDPSKGVFMQISNTSDNPYFNAISWNKGVEDLSKKLGFSTEPVKLGRTASRKVVREAIVAVPFYDYKPGGRNVEDERKFLEIPAAVIQDAKEGKGKQSVIDMVNKMQRFVMPPMFNFLEDLDITPLTMYIFDFKHTFDQEDLGAIWQNLPPKLMTQFQTEEKTISHTFDEEELLSLATLEETGQGDPLKIMQKLRWMVFKVKQKASQNYYDKVVGETQTLNKKSPYSHNWPYDYFSLVELAKIETKVDFMEPPPESNQEAIVLPALGRVPKPPIPEVKPRERDRKSLLGDVVPAPSILENRRSLKTPEKTVVTPSKPKIKEVPKIDNKTNNVKQPVSNPPKTRERDKNNKKSGLNNLKDRKDKKDDKKDDKQDNPRGDRRQDYPRGGRR